MEKKREKRLVQVMSTFNGILSYKEPDSAFYHGSGLVCLVFPMSHRTMSRKITS